MWCEVTWYDETWTCLTWPQSSRRHQMWLPGFGSERKSGILSYNFPFRCNHSQAVHHVLRECSPEDIVGRYSHKKGGYNGSNDVILKHVSMSGLKGKNENFDRPQRNKSPTSLFIARKRRKYWTTEFPDQLIQQINFSAAGNDEFFIIALADLGWLYRDKTREACRVGWIKPGLLWFSSSLFGSCHVGSCLFG
jgi:hypothetical protein